VHGVEVLVDGRTFIVAINFLQNHATLARGFGLDGVVRAAGCPFYRHAEDVFVVLPLARPSPEGEIGTVFAGFGGLVVPVPNLLTK
jgi:hypothetical protein